MLDELSKRAEKALSSIGQHDAGMAMAKIAEMAKQANASMAQSHDRNAASIIKVTKAIEKYNEATKTTLSTIEGYNTDGQKQR